MKEDYKLTPHFSYNELTRSQVASRSDIDNTPPPQAITNLMRGCSSILEPARAAMGPIRVLSGYRSQKLNHAVGGSLNSSHMTGEAVDVVPLNCTILQLAEWIFANVKFDQLILEYGTKENPHWLHIGWGPKMRGEVLYIGRAPKYERLSW